MISADRPFSQIDFSNHILFDSESKNIFWNNGFSIPPTQLVQSKWLRLDVILKQCGLSGSNPVCILLFDFFIKIFDLPFPWAAKEVTVLHKDEQLSQVVAFQHGGCDYSVWHHPYHDFIRSIFNLADSFGLLDQHVVDNRLSPSLFNKFVLSALHLAFQPTYPQIPLNIIRNDDVTVSLARSILQKAKTVTELSRFMLQNNCYPHHSLIHVDNYKEFLPSEGQLMYLARKIAIQHTEHRGILGPITWAFNALTLPTELSQNIILTTKTKVKESNNSDDYVKNIPNSHPNNLHEDHNSSHALTPNNTLSSITPSSVIFPPKKRNKIVSNSSSGKWLPMKKTVPSLMQPIAIPNIIKPPLCYAPVNPSRFPVVHFADNNIPSQVAPPHLALYLPWKDTHNEALAAELTLIKQRSKALAVSDDLQTPSPTTNFIPPPLKTFVPPHARMFINPVHGKSKILHANAPGRSLEWDSATINSAETDTYEAKLADICVKLSIKQDCNVFSADSHNAFDVDRYPNENLLQSIPSFNSLAEMNKSEKIDSLIHTGRSTISIPVDTSIKNNNTDVKATKLSLAENSDSVSVSKYVGTAQSEHSIIDNQNIDKLKVKTNYSSSSASSSENASTTRVSQRQFPSHPPYSSTRNSGDHISCERENFCTSSSSSRLNENQSCRFKDKQPTCEFKSDGILDIVSPPSTAMNIQSNLQNSESSSSHQSNHESSLSFMKKYFEPFHRPSSLPTNQRESSSSPSSSLPDNFISVEVISLSAVTPSEVQLCRPFDATASTNHAPILSDVMSLPLSHYSIAMKNDESLTICPANDSISSLVRPLTAPPESRQVNSEKTSKSLSSIRRTSKFLEESNTNVSASSIRDSLYNVPEMVDESRTFEESTYSYLRDPIRLQCEQSATRDVRSSSVSLRDLNIIDPTCQLSAFPMELRNSNQTRRSSLDNGVREGSDHLLFEKDILLSHGAEVEIISVDLAENELNKSVHNSECRSPSPIYSTVIEYLQTFLYPKLIWTLEAEHAAEELKKRRITERQKIIDEEIRIKKEKELLMKREQAELLIESRLELIRNQRSLELNNQIASSKKIIDSPLDLGDGSFAMIEIEDTTKIDAFSDDKGQSNLGENVDQRKTGLVVTVANLDGDTFEIRLEGKQSSEKKDNGRSTLQSFSHNTSEDESKVAPSFISCGVSALHLSDVSVHSNGCQTFQSPTIASFTQTGHDFLKSFHHNIGSQASPKVATAFTQSSGYTIPIANNSGDSSMQPMRQGFNKISEDKSSSIDTLKHPSPINGWPTLPDNFHPNPLIPFIQNDVSNIPIQQHPPGFVLSTDAVSDLVSCLKDSLQATMRQENKQMLEKISKETKQSTKETESMKKQLEEMNLRIMEEEKQKESAINRLKELQGELFKYKSEKKAKKDIKGANKSLLGLRDSAMFRIYAQSFTILPPNKVKGLNIRQKNSEASFNSYSSIYSSPQAPKKSPPKPFLMKIPSNTKSHSNQTFDGGKQKANVSNSLSINKEIPVNSLLSLPEREFPQRRMHPGTSAISYGKTAPINAIRSVCETIPLKKSCSTSLIRQQSPKLQCTPTQRIDVSKLSLPTTATARIEKGRENKPRSVEFVGDVIYSP